MSEAELEASFTLAWSQRGLRQSRARGGTARGRPRRASPVPGRAAPARTRSSRPTSSASSASSWAATGSAAAGTGSMSCRRGRGRPGPLSRRALSPDASADVVSPTLDMLGPERVTITDYKSSDVRDPVKARQRARDSLQLQIYAMGYEAMTGRLPDAVALHFLESGLVGEVAVDPKRLAKAARRSNRPPPACEPATTPPRRTTSPARTAPSATSARRASPGDRAFARVDGSASRPPSSGLLAAGARRSPDRRLHRPWRMTGPGTPATRIRSSASPEPRVRPRVPAARCRSWSCDGDRRGVQPRPPGPAATPGFEVIAATDGRAALRQVFATSETARACSSARSSCPACPASNWLPA